MTMDKIDNGDALNLSTGIFTSFKEFARLAAETCGSNPEIVGTSNRPEGVFARGGDVTRQHEYGFRHQITLQDGITKAIQHFSDKLAKKQR